jgi:hypothetical protein
VAVDEGFRVRAINLRLVPRAGCRLRLPMLELPFAISTIFPAEELRRSKEEQNESQGIGQEDVRQLQGHPQAGSGESDLHQPEAQTAARLVLKKRRVARSR